ncbi:hypothetical protein F9Z99_23340 [Bacteroides fragilis]|nr:hypothetical protein F9Z99_23340 [Bacteroides fragilis]
MKFVVLVVFLGIAAFAKAELADDLNEFLELVPQKKVVQTALRYFTSDKEVRGFVKYLKQDEFKAAWVLVTEHEEVQKFVAYLQSKGVDVVPTLNKVADFLHLPHFPNSGELRFGHDAAVYKKGKGLKGLVEDVLALLPFDKLEKLFKEKLESSADFKELYDTVAGFNYEEVEKFVQESKELTAVLTKLGGYGLDLEGYLKAVKDFFGWN